MAGLSKIYIIISVAVIIATTSSCIYDSTPECPSDDTVEIVIKNDWTAAPDAAPEGMAYLFFKNGFLNPWRFDFPGREAGKVSLGTGIYSFVMFNDDTSDIVFKKDAAGRPFVTTRPDTVSFKGIADNVHEPPDIMWSAPIHTVVVDNVGVEYTSGDSIVGQSGSYVIVTTPVQITPEFNIKVLHVENLQGVAAMKGLITGMTSGIDLYEKKSSDREVAVSFSPVISTDSIVMSSFYTFGLPPNRNPGNELRLYFQLSDGRLICEMFDVSDKVVSAPDPMKIEIVIDSVSLPYAPPAGEGGAFNPEVAGWITVEVNYET